MPKTFLALVVLLTACSSQEQDTPYAGAKSCKPCHEKFYELWAPSHHGLAMQPYTPEFAQKNLTPQKEAIKTYQAETGPNQGWVLEGNKKKYPIQHVLGGKNVYYFLTPLDRGRLQTLPVAFDVRKKEWFDTAASGMRHFGDEPVDWRDSVYTFNTACYKCHVSQLSINYDLETNTYNTQWAEPGINCETCHGPCQEHIRVCEKNENPKDLKILMVGGDKNTVEQNNASCAPCHAKIRPLTDAFMPGDRFFDHFDLTALEDPDFYPDGRDLGENYTYTRWLMSPCVKSGKLTCLFCHTSSGRYRHKDDPSQSCLPCHDQSQEHTRHPQKENTPNCVSCHMPLTEFARMQRSDHSMLPPHLQ